MTERRAVIEAIEDPHGFIQVAVYLIPPLDTDEEDEILVTGCHAYMMDKWENYFQGDAINEQDN